nr:MAG TPA: hypothetical protein [Caudoviricetes sp.]
MLTSSFSSSLNSANSFLISVIESLINCSI